MNKTKLQIDYISDIHIDNWEISLNTNFKEILFNIFKNKQSDILVLAGDITVTPAKAKEVVSFLTKEKKYRAILYVLGNHELYTDRKINSIADKCFQYKKAISYIENAYFLDSDGININGKNIYGWNPLYGSSIKDLYDFNSCLSDSSFFSYQDMLEWNENQKNKARKDLGNEDLIISHVKPICSKEFVAEKFKDSNINKFFCFEGEEFYTKTKNYIFGHTHTPMEFNYNGVAFHSNPLGYPNENKNNNTYKNSLKTIEI